jgi:hypothetical protein
MRSAVPSVDDVFPVHGEACPTATIVAASLKCITKRIVIYAVAKFDVATSAKGTSFQH